MIQTVLCTQNGPTPLVNEKRMPLELWNYMIIKWYYNLIVKIWVAKQGIVSIWKCGYMQFLWSVYDFLIGKEHVFYFI